MNPTSWTHPELAREPVAWLATAGPGGRAAMVPTWFAWDGEALLVASKPDARKVRNVRANPLVMVGIARVGVEMTAQLVEGRAEVLPVPSRVAFAGADLAKYEALLAADGLTRDAFFARYPTAIRIAPTRFLPWQGPALARGPQAASSPATPAVARGRRGPGVRERLGRGLRSARAALVAGRRAQALAATA